MANKNLGNAKVAKNDEFYTQMNDIAEELYHYRHHFVGKKILLNCDDPRTSNFWQYFELNFDELKLEKLTSTHYDPEEPTYKLEMTRGVDVNGDGVMDGHDIVQTPLIGNGDFRSAECIELLKEADIVITNPPFSLWREYISQLFEYEKQFIILGSQNAVKYKEVFPLFQNNQIWVGFTSNKTMEFIMPEDYELKGKAFIDDEGRKHGFVPACSWFTNLDIDKRHDKLTLWKDYAGNEKDYPTYNNFDGIDVAKISEIPRDYYGKMGVPITFLNEYSPEQFKIIGLGEGDLAKLIGVKRNHEGRTKVEFEAADGTYKRPYARVIIQRVDQPENPQEGGEE